MRKQQTRPVVIPLGPKLVLMAAAVVLAAPILSLIFWILG
jgi:hypothetical protein